ncbi:hypothetical protein AB7M47_005455 [Bradyrhizobium elkanii]
MRPSFETPRKRAAPPATKAKPLRGDDAGYAARALFGGYFTSICKPSFSMIAANFFVSASTKSENCWGVP